MLKDLWVKLLCDGTAQVGHHPCLDTRHLVAQKKVTVRVGHFEKPDSVDVVSAYLGEIDAGGKRRVFWIYADPALSIHWFHHGGHDSLTKPTSFIARVEITIGEIQRDFEIEGLRHQLDVAKKMHRECV